MTRHHPTFHFNERVEDWTSFQLKPLVYKNRRGEAKTILYLYLVDNLQTYGQEAKLIYNIFQIAKLIVLDFVKAGNYLQPALKQIEFIITSLQEVNSEKSCLVLELIELVSYFLKRQSDVELIGSSQGLYNKTLLRYLYALALVDDIEAFAELKSIASLAKKIGMNKSEWMEFKKKAKEEITSKQPSYGRNYILNKNIHMNDSINIFKGLDFDKERLIKYVDFMNPVMGHWLRIKSDKAQNMIFKFDYSLNAPDLLSFRKNTRHEVLSSFHEPRFRLEMLQENKVISRQYDEVNKLSSLLKFSLGIRAAELDKNIAESTKISLAEQLASYEKILELSIRNIYEEIKIITQVKCQLESLKELIEKAAFADKRNLIKIKVRIAKTYAHHRKAMEEVIAILHKLLITLGQQHKLTKRFDTDMSRSIKELEFWGDKMNLY